MLLVGVSGFTQIEFRLGDKELETELNTLNSSAEKDLTKFKAEMKEQFGLAGAQVDEYLKIMKPAEIILAGRIGKVSKKPVDKVVNVYRANKDKGWGYVAKEMGIKPGSPEFHALKGKTKRTKMLSKLRTKAITVIRVRKEKANKISSNLGQI